MASLSTLFGLSKFLAPITGAFSGRWKELTLVLLAAIVIYQNTFDTRLIFWANTIPYLKEQIASQEHIIEREESANAVLASEIERINNEIGQWRQVSEQLESANDVLQNDLRAAREATHNRVRTILEAPTPQSCEAAMNFLRDAIPSLQFEVYIEEVERRKR